MRLSNASLERYRYTKILSNVMHVKITDRNKYSAATSCRDVFYHLRDRVIQLVRVIVLTRDLREM